MKHYLILSIAALMGFVCLVSCCELESDLPSSNHQLRIVTHTREGEAPLANVYLFNAKNTLVRTIQTDAAGSYTTASASVKLSADTYTLCALNTSDLAHFQIPDNPTPTSVITKATDQTLGDLLMATASTTLSDGASDEVNMTLQRKVLKLSTISISQVPSDVTGVSVSISPFYSGIQFNCTYVETSPVACSFNLVASTTTGLWELAPEQFVFPSKGIPTITITFARDNNEATVYTYTADEALTANNKYNISGTYTEPLGVTLAGSIALQPWPANPTPVNFDFDEQNASNTSNTDPNSGSGTDDPSSQGGGNSSDTPVAGQTYKGCYVVSVDESKHTAVLLSPTEKQGKDYSNEIQSDWLSYVNGIVSSWTSVPDVNGVWRLPTNSEVNAFAYDSDFLNGLISNGSRKYVFFLDNTVLKAASFSKKANGYSTEIIDNSYSFNQIYYIRPVIDYDYQPSN